MTTRQQHFNSRGKTLGDTLARLDLQTGWHLATDDEHILWPTAPTEGLLPTGVHPRKPSSIDSLATCIEYLNQLKVQYDLHRVDTDYHIAADTTNDVTSADATDLASAYTLANEIKTDFNAHIAGGLGGAHTHTVPAHTHDLFLNNGDVVDGAGTRVNAGTNLLGANTGADITVAGITATTGPGGILQVAAGVTGSGGGAGSSDYHSPMGDNINTITAADATTLATLKALTLQLVTNYHRHLFVGALAMDEDI